MTGTSMLDFSDFITDRTRDFTGRGWVFTEINRWLADSASSRAFLLVGGAGTGKSAVLARLAQFSLGQASTGSCPRLSPGFLAYHHFCQAQQDATLNPVRFVEALSLALAQAYQPFAKALVELNQGDKQITINATQTVTTAADSSQVQNVVIQNLSVGNPPARVAFDLTVRRPLEVLCSTEFKERLVVLVDSLDEARTWREKENILTLLGETLDDPRDLPPQFRFILACRPDERVLQAIGLAPSLDLIAAAPPDAQEVRLYTSIRLAKAPLDVTLRDELASRLAEASAGNFLYARYVLDDWLARPAKITLKSALDLPAGLSEIYGIFLKRELARDEEKWEDRYQPLLGLLAVARGEGLLPATLAGASGKKPREVDNALRACAQYLAGPQPDGPFRIYHQSFREFLLATEEYQVYPAESNQAIAEFFLAEYHGDWINCEATYALQYTPTHLLEAAQRTKQRRVRAKLAVALITLLTDLGFLEQKTAQVGIDALLTDMHAALRLDGESTSAVQAVSRILDREANNVRDWDRAQHPAFFAQQIHNHAVELRHADLADAAARRLAQMGKPYLRLHWRIPNEPLALVRTLTEIAHKVAVTPDSRYLLSLSIHGLKVWNLETGQDIHALAGVWDPMGFTADGSQAVLASERSITFWDVYTGKVARVLQSNDHWERALTLTCDTKRAICITRDASLRLIDLETGAVVQQLSGSVAEPDARFLVLVVTPDDHYVIASSPVGPLPETGGQLEAARLPLQMWDLETGQEVSGSLGVQVRADDIVVSSNGHLVLAITNNYLLNNHMLKVWETQTRREVFSIETDVSLQAMAVTPDSRHVLVACGGEPGNLRVWDLHTGHQVAAFAAHSYPISDVMTTPNGRYAITTSDDIKVWDLKAVQVGQAGQTQITQLGSVWLEALSPDGRLAIFQTQNTVLKVWDMLKVWDVLSNREVHSLAGHEGIVRAVAVTSDNHYAISSGDDRSLKIWDLQSGRELHTISSDCFEWPGMPITISRDNRYLITCAGIWDIQTRQLVGSVEGLEKCQVHAISPDGCRGVSGTGEGQLHFWDVQQRQLVYTVKAHEGLINQVVITPDGRFVVSVPLDYDETDHTIGVWDLEQGQVVHRLSGHRGWIRAVAVTPDSRHIISASNDATIKVWDLQTGQEVRSLIGHTDWVYDMVLTGDGNLVFSASQDRTLRVWDWKTGQTLATATLAGILTRLKVAPDERTVVVQERGGSIYCLRYVDPNAS